MPVPWLRPIRLTLFIQLQPTLEWLPSPTVVAQAKDALARNPWQSKLSQLLCIVSAALQGLSSLASGLVGILSELGSRLNRFAQGSANYPTGLDGFLSIYYGTSNIVLVVMLNPALGNSIFGSGFFALALRVGVFTNFLGCGAVRQTLRDIVTGGWWRGARTSSRHRRTGRFRERSVG